MEVSDLTYTGIFKKRKGRRSSGEVIVFPRSKMNPPPNVASFIPATDALFPNGIEENDPEQLVEELKMKLQVSQADDDYLLEFWDEISELAAHTLKITMTHDKKSLSIQQQEIDFFHNKHYRGKRLLHTYRTIRRVSLYKQHVNGDYYLRAFGGNSRNPRDIPVPPHTVLSLRGREDSNPTRDKMIERVLSLFLEVPVEEVEETYNAKAYPVVSKIFPLHDFSEMGKAKAKLFNYMPGWRHVEKAETFTKAVSSAIEGKPRKDFVRALASHINNPPHNDEAMLSEISGALFLMRLAKKGWFDFDFEDFIIKTLQERKKETYLSVFSSRVAEIESKNRSEQLKGTFVLVLAEFLGERRFKKVLRNAEEGRENAPFSLWFYNDTTDMMLSCLGVSYADREIINRALSKKKQHQREAIEKAKQVLRPNRETQILLEESGLSGDTSLMGVHDVLSFYTRTHHFMNSKDPRLSLDHEVPRNELSSLNDSLEEIVVGDDVYVWEAPKINKDIVLWSSMLNNCMSSYIRDVQDGSYTLSFVRKNGKPYAALGVFNNSKSSSKKFRYDQFYAACNQPIPKELGDVLYAPLDPYIA